jgi:hypothetical protein
MKCSRFCLIFFVLLSLQISLLSASYAGGLLSVNVSTDKQSYGLGEVITITGKISDETTQGVAFASVSIQVNDPNGNPIHLTSVLSGVDGSFGDQFTVPASSADGDYTVFASASKPGYVDASNQTAYAVIPEFPSMTVLWLIPFSVLLAMLLTRRQESAGN